MSPVVKAVKSVFKGVAKIVGGLFGVEEPKQQSQQILSRLPELKAVIDTKEADAAARKVHVRRGQASTVLAGKEAEKDDDTKTAKKVLLGA